MTARQRNNIARLPQPARYRICELLDDGATYDAIRADPEVSAACTERGLTLHSTTFIAYRESGEYQEFLQARRRYGDEISKIRATAMVVDSLDGPNAIARKANFELLRIVMSKLEAGEDLEAKELSSISGALAAYERNRIAADKEDARRDFAAREAEYQAKIAELSAKIAGLTEGAVRGGGLSDEALREIEERAGML